MSLHVLVMTVVHTPLDARIHRRQLVSLLDAGHRVTYAAPFTGHGVDPADVDSRLEVVDLPRAAGRRRIAALRGARRLLRDLAGDVDVVLVHDPELLLAVLGATRGTPVVWDVHEDLGASLADKPWLPRWTRGVVRGLVRAVERLAERHVTILLAEDAYRTRFRRSHVVVPNLPPLPAWTPRGPVDRRVVYLGRVSVLRGARELLELGRRLREDGITVEVVGPVDDEIATEVAAAAARGDVVAPGFVANDAAMRRLDGALAGLSLLHDHPNYRHSLPTKVVEYQAAAVPVVTTPLPAAVAMVERLGSGHVVPFRDVTTVLALIRGLRADPERARMLARAGRDGAEGGWSWDAVAHTFVDTVQRAARPGDGV